LTLSTFKTFDVSISVSSVVSLRKVGSCDDLAWNVVKKVFNLKTKRQKGFQLQDKKTKRFSTSRQKDKKPFFFKLMLRERKNEVSVM
jgi:hypothetical protein